MKITIEHHDNQFNVSLYGREDEPFLTIKGCRIANGRNGEFVSWPATKKDGGKWWQHVYASQAFADAVFQQYRATKQQPAKRPRADDDDLPPF